MELFGSHWCNNEEEGLVLGRYYGSPVKKVVKNHRRYELDYKEMNLKEAWNMKN